MKRLLKLSFILFVVFNFNFIVDAKDYKFESLIPADVKATVKGEKFNYENFIFNSYGGSLTFGSIKNNKVSSTAVSFDILLFDKDKRNIGLISYCTDKDDKNPDLYGLKISGKESIPFSIVVDSKYFVNGRNSNDVKYIAVLDENVYCKNYDASKYADLTLNEINQGEVNTNKVLDIMSYFSTSKFLLMILAIPLIIVILIAFVGLVVNTLHKRMYVKTNVLSFIPIINFYLSVKLAFGNIVAFLYFLLVIVSCVLLFVDIYILWFVVAGIFLLSFLINLIKLLTKKYDLFYFEPSVNSSFDKSVAKEQKKEKKKKKKSKDLGNEVLDLSYNDIDMEEDDNFKLNSSDISMMEEKDNSLKLDDSNSNMMGEKDNNLKLDDSNDNIENEVKDDSLDEQIEPLSELEDSFLDNSSNNIDVDEDRLDDDEDEDEKFADDEIFEDDDE